MDRVGEIIGAAMLLSTGFLTGFWNDILLVITVSILLAGAAWAGPQRIPTIKLWWANWRRFSVAPPTPWAIATEGVGKITITANRKTIVSSVTATFHTSDGISPPREIVRVTRTVPSDQAGVKGGGAQYSFPQPQVLEKHEVINFNIEYEAHQTFEGTLMLTMHLAGYRFELSLNKSVPVVIGQGVSQSNPQTSGDQSEPAAK